MRSQVQKRSEEFPWRRVSRIVVSRRAAEFARNRGGVEIDGDAAIVKQNAVEMERKLGFV